MSVIMDSLEGQIFGQWKVTGEFEKRKIKEISRNRLYQKCKCLKCGNEQWIRRDNIKRCNSICDNCGRNKGPSKKYRKPERMVWWSLRARCYNKKHKNYPGYGGRGITVCDRWLESFDNFLEDMGKRPSDKYSIERIDNDKGYSPDNCKWATREEQHYNKRTTKLVEYNGKKMTIPEISKETGLTYETIRRRLRYRIPLDSPYRTQTHTRSFDYNIKGQFFGKWLVMDNGQKMKGKTYYKCECSCGNERYISFSELIRGKTKGCIKCLHIKY